jgi:hypothetical protein
MESPFYRYVPKPPGLVIDSHIALYERSAVWFLKRSILGTHSVRKSDRDRDLESVSSTA